MGCYVWISLNTPSHLIITLVPNHASIQTNPRFPDFRQTSTAEKGVWIDSKLTSSRIHARIFATVKVQEQPHGQYVKAVKMGNLWQEFFSDPSQWWDNRSTKTNPRYPDFEHKSTHEGLWIEGWLNPPWVNEKLAALAEGRVISGDGLRLRSPDCCGDARDVSLLCQEGRLEDAVHQLKLMSEQNIQAPISTYTFLLNECARRKALVEGKQVHALIVRRRLDSNMFLGNTLINMYAKCGSVLDARQVFDSMPQRNVFSWTVIISAYTNHGQSKEAVFLFQQMRQTGIPPDKVTFITVLKACTSIQALEQGKQVHADIITCGFEGEMTIGGALVDMYAKCGRIEDAREVFDKMLDRNVVSWNIMIAGYAQQGLGKEALNIYEQMKQEAVQPTIVTFVVLLKACAAIAALEQGKQLHLEITRRGFHTDMVVASTLVDMYAKCGQMEDARRIFENMHDQDIVSWTAIITGYAQQGLGKESLGLYKQMKQESLVQPDFVIYAVLLKACAQIPALEEGKQLHLDSIRCRFDSHVMVGSSLVDMYAKCGEIEDACRVFNNMPERDAVAWNVMITAYAQQGLGKEALILWNHMCREGKKPDEVTYISVLSACSHSGLIDQGRHLFYSMRKNHGVIPNSDHYVCMVDLLGRAGHLTEAEEFISKMPVQPNVLVWMTLLGAARIHCDVEIGRRAFDVVVKLDPENSAPFVLLSNIYAAAGLMDEAANIIRKMNDAGLKGMPDAGSEYMADVGSKYMPDAVASKYTALKV